jgi:hypothetical protein
MQTDRADRRTDASDTAEGGMDLLGGTVYPVARVKHGRVQLSEVSLFECFPHRVANVHSDLPAPSAETWVSAAAQATASRWAGGSMSSMACTHRRYSTSAMPGEPLEHRARVTRSAGPP